MSKQQEAKKIVVGEIVEALKNAKSFIFFQYTTLTGKEITELRKKLYTHNAHMHVRLKCPEGNSLCQTQAPIPSSGDGCGMEVTSWLDEIRFPKPKKPGAKVKPKKLPDPPIECVELFKAHKVKK